MARFLKHVSPLAYSALLAALTLVLVFCVWTAVGIPRRCPFESAAAGALLIMAFTWPITMIAMLCAACFGYVFPRWTFSVLATLIALSVAAIGVAEAIPHYNYLPGDVRCRLDS